MSEKTTAQDGTPDTSTDTTEKTTTTNGIAKAAPASSLSAKERDEIAALPYEEARDRLIQSVQALEGGGLNLDQSMRQWELGEALAKRAQALLSEVRAKLDAAQAQQESSADTAGTQSNLD
ncbi:exodeoxyribonuclease VII small subunit [Bifidobacterium mongoliense]|uniref:Exodeoxyribonuclease 7 small subunit n=1 Tax=Bifidobacterium mongoliense TaxID=518643 RepID=A0A423UFK2_9BIFI|nr:exodeoxyribonuclease VII small subunit [Bifidobacterium mongoliense]ROT87484.1 Exonuclease VII, small subunit [Bifidobacterium mongoliense]